VIGALVVGALVLLSYEVESCRAGRVWRHHQADLIARGLNLDWRAYLPAPVPDAENFAKTPLIEREGYRGRGTVQFAQGVPSWAGYVGDWSQGKANDLEGYEAMVTGRGGAGAGTGGGRIGAVTLTALEPVGPALGELRLASHRSHASFDARGDSPWELTVPNFVFIREANQLASLRASAWQALGQPQEAMEDIRVIFKFGEALNSHHTLVAAMLRASLLGGMGLQNFWEGWRAGVWTDQQLLEFQQRFSEIDLLGAYTTALNGGERAGVHWLVQNCSRRQLLNTLGRGWAVSVGDRPPYCPEWVYYGRQAWAWVDLGVHNARLWLMPRAWLYTSLINYDRLIDPALAACDPQARRFYPERAQAAAQAVEAEIERLGDSDPLVIMAMPNLLRAGSRCASYQVSLDQACIVCALERYKRAHQAYPETLGALVPTYAARLPHDLITGQPFQYHRSGGGGFLLYSVGFDQKDDQGSRSADLLSGDWVWPN
jgi:hypothetical protein